MKNSLILLIFSFICLSPVSAGSYDSEFDFMYGASFTFQNGIPFVRVHIKTYNSGLEIKDISSISCNGHDYPADSVTLNVKSFFPAEVKYKLVFTELSMSEIKNYESIILKWNESAKVSTEVYVHGAIFSINASRIDNREYFIALPGLLDKAGSEKTLEKYRKMFPENNIFLIPVLTKTADSEISVKTSKGETVNCRKIVFIKNNNAAQMSAGNDKYSGINSFFITASSDSKLELAGEDSVENLIQKILPGEMFLSAPLETLKAQAVAARTDIFMQLGKRHVAEPWHICSEVHCQKVLWNTKIDQKFNDAVKQTDGQIILYDGSYIARAPYCSSSGGRTENIMNVWFTAEKPYLSGVWDGDIPPALDLTKESDFEKFLDSDFGEDNIPMNKKHRWTVEFSQNEIDALLEKSLNIGKLKKINALKRGTSGRIFKIEFIGDISSQTVYGELNIRRLLKNMYSSAFIVKNENGKWVFRGAGWGHGVGMSQIGAISLGKKGHDFKYMLKRYYPGTEVVKIY
ncbi:MAG TPA: SpoIID/LytB domain-containing protein [bacterium]|nr:SpoIID/LytB domain-containing protein [bacterium]HPS29068.1 SpoIID/LytB domain-containing protein [bacterium]